jgi:hypothetical protein
MINFISKIYKIIFLGIILSSCATAYKPTGLSGGYEDVDLGGGRYKVAFNANGYTSDNEAIQLAKRRAGELCNGSYDILEQDLEKSSFYKKPSVKLIVQCK